MAIDYPALAAVATQLLQDAGRQVTFVRLEETPSDSAEPWNGATTPRAAADSETNAFAAAVPPSSAVALGIATLDTDFVKRAEQILIVSPAAGDLDSYDEVIDGDIRWRINSTEKLQPAGTVLLYFASVRR